VCLGCGGTFDYHFITNLLVSLLLILNNLIFKNQLTSGKVTGKNVDFEKCTYALSFWKIKNWPKIWCIAVEMVVTASPCNNRLHWQWIQQISNWCIVDHLWLTDWCHQWLNADRMCRHFVVTFWLPWGIQLVVVGFLLATMNYLFIQEPDDANVSTWIFFSNCIK